MSIADTLEAAAKLIEPDGAWTQNYYARNEKRRSVSARSDAAQCWCALGAIRKIADVRDDLTPTAFYLKSQVPAFSVDLWNDAPGRTQAEVVTKLREAAAIAREQGL